ncbi:D-alanyl-D-alanine carboxypeptidase/D-alanyl-D-alanine-endopeptidase [Novosphingobium aquiterrae]|uniref:D-alanyl-D-alanine carboxypeptidase/D-alanyl-D-alanine-endopeptidase n=1 Tax=Novosphingobium aquiterrae TaxID=624388 RepID=A0ABV6PGB2_9SPHN
MKRNCIALALLFLPAAAFAQSAPPLQQQVETVLAQAPAGTRFGLLVVDQDGREVVAINPDQRFIPASNTKLFTTAAAMAVLGQDEPAAETAAMTSLALVPAKRGAPDVVLKGGGTALSTAGDCVKRCLGGLVSGIAMKTRKVGNVIADDTAFVDQRWSPGMSWNNIPTDSGTATSALVIDDNELPLTVTATQPGTPGTVAVSPYLTVRNETRTVADGETKLGYDRAVNGRELRVFGTILADALPWKELLGIDDPADYAAWTVRQALEARGVKVTGKVVVRHRPAHSAAPAAVPAVAGAFALGVTPPPLAEEIALINKPSQNLHAEVLLRRIGLAAQAQDVFGPDNSEPGSIEAGQAALRTVLTKAGIARAGYDFSDGSGMSTYNRVSPRAAVALLRWAATQSWGDVWRASLPIGAVDGTLRRRFAGTALAGKVWAKTGTLNATNALSGYMQAASGRVLTFSILANDVPDGGNALVAMDAAVSLIAAAN